MWRDSVKSNGPNGMLTSNVVRSSGGTGHPREPLRTSSSWKMVRSAKSAIAERAQRERERAQAPNRERDEHADDRRQQRPGDDGHREAQRPSVHHHGDAEAPLVVHEPADHEAGRGHERRLGRLTIPPIPVITTNDRKMIAEHEAAGHQPGPELDSRTTARTRRARRRTPPTAAAAATWAGRCDGPPAARSSDIDPAARDRSRPRKKRRTTVRMNGIDDRNPEMSVRKSGRVPVGTGSARRRGRARPRTRSGSSAGRRARPPRATRARRRCTWRRTRPG